MKKIRTIAVWLLLLLLSLSLFACSAESEEEGEEEAPKGTVTLYVYNWGEYMADGSIYDETTGERYPDVNKDFEDWYYETYHRRVKVNYSTYSSNEDMYAKIKSGAVKYDVVVPSDYMIERMINEELLRPLNFENIPDFEENILDEFKNPSYDPENAYSVPYAYGMVGIIYNTETVDEDDEDLGSWRLMFNEDTPYSKDILQFNNPRDAFGTALYYLGYDVNDATEEQWREALELLKTQKNILQGYVMDEIFNKMKSGSSAIAAYYAGDYLSMYEDNDSLEFFYPKEGTNYYVDAFCVPYNSPNPDIAEAYINFMINEDPAVANAEYNYYASPNKLVRESEEYQECMADVKDNAYEILYPDSSESFEDYDSYVKTMYKDLGEEGLTRMNDYWEELKVESSINAGIYIICGVIVAVIVGFTVYFLVRKRIRAI